MDDDLASVLKDLAGEDDLQAATTRDALDALDGQEVAALAEEATGEVRPTEGAHSFSFGDAKKLFGNMFFVLEWIGKLIRKYRELQREFDENEEKQQRELLIKVLRDNVRISEERAEMVAVKYFKRLKIASQQASTSK